MAAGLKADVGELLAFEVELLPAFDRGHEAGMRDSLRLLVALIDHEHGVAVLRDPASGEAYSYYDGYLTRGRPTPAKYAIVSVASRGLRRNAVRRWRMAELVELIESLQQPPLTIVRVPEIVRAWPGGVEDGKRALLEGHRAGLVELRCESGVGLLSREDAALCPRGARGCPLSYARLV